MYSFDQIPTHGRWRHADAGRARVQPLIDGWASSANPLDKTEVARRLLDLFLVSGELPVSTEWIFLCSRITYISTPVLLDAGAGNDWSYKETTASGTATYTRSEGLAVASVQMFADGVFSSVPDQPHRVDAKGLASVGASAVASAMQVSDKNPMVGLEGRAGLLRNLSKALSENPQFFGPDGRPGGIVGMCSVPSRDHREVLRLIKSCRLPRNSKEGYKRHTHRTRCRSLDRINRWSRIYLARAGSWQWAYLTWRRPAWRRVALPRASGHSRRVPSSRGRPGAVPQADRLDDLFTH
jgi:hypothetical protein